MPTYASWPRRIAALVIDWLVSTLVTIGFVGLGDYAREGSPAGWIVLLVFAAQVSVLTALTGGSFGQLLTGIRVLRTDGHPLSLLMAVARTLLICLVIPPLVYKTETGRGLHDLATSSAAYRRQQPPGS